ncbi:MAG: cobaltochelatase subunit CobN, partial [Ectothiorhodospiraceae bacterium]|nr:cobaltochelatase subunit CobN [Ectothiorhodospiraceae bacterium]
LGGRARGAKGAGGERPTLYISNLRDPASAQTERADRFLSRELRTRYHHPRWLQSMVNEGYSGTTTLQATIENFWGWQATAPEMVRDDQWTRFFDIYVDDAYDLGLAEWFESHNPEALTRIIERMLDAVRTGHWTPDDAVLEALVAHHHDWTEAHGGSNDSAARDEFIMETAAGFGMNAAMPGGAAQPVTVTGQVMQPVSEAGAESARDWLTLLYLLALLLCFLLGVGHQGWRARRASIHPDRGFPA